VLEIPLYEWALPEDQEPLVRFIQDVIAERIDVVAFTSSPQINAIAEYLTREEDHHARS
jgi:uroporphyrinogen-III synthase